MRQTLHDARAASSRQTLGELGEAIARKRGALTEREAQEASPGTEDMRAALELAMLQRPPTDDDVGGGDA